MAFEEVGIALVVDGLAEFKSGTREAEESVTGVGAAADQASEQSSFLGDALGTLGGIAEGVLVAGFAAATVAATALAGALGVGIAGALENEQTMARLESQLKATGGAAGLTMDDLTDLGAEFQDLAGGSDDLIYSIESVGLRFSSITADVMPDFIQASLDMAAVMGTDATSSAQMLAMALEGGTSSLGRLKRAGIMFTDQEVEQMKAMEDAGDAAGVQQMMLEKLANTVGGAAAAQAETLAGKWEIMKGRFGEAAEAVGMALLPVLTNLFDTVIAPAIPIIETLATGLGEALGLFFSGQEDIQGASDVFAEFANNVLPGSAEPIRQVGAALQGLSDFINTSVIPAVRDIAAWLAVNLPPAIQTASDFFNNVIKPALEAVGVFIRDTVVPAVSDIITWLSINLPPAIQTASDFFNNVILPALRDVEAFIRDNVVPVVSDIVTWLQTNLPPAIQAASDFFNNTLLPAVTDIYNFINDNVVPVLTTLADVALAAVEVALAALEVVWREVLKPALEALWGFFKDNILPILEDVRKKIEESLGPALEWFKLNVLDPLATSLGGVRDFLQSVATKLGELKTSLQNLQLPEWLTPGSPTPFEIGMRGAADAARELSRAMAPLMAASELGITLSAAAGPSVSSHPTLMGGAVTNTQNITVAPTYNSGVRGPKPGQITDDVLLAMALL